MKNKVNRNSKGFSLIELTVAMAIVLILLGIVSTLLGQSMGIRARESRKTDALTSAMAAMNIMSREISNAGFGVYEGSSIDPVPSNGLIVNDSYLDPSTGYSQLRFRANLTNAGPGSASTMGCPPACTNEPGEDVTYFFDDATKSIVRYDPHGVEISPGVYGPQTSVVVNRISNVRFKYFDYQADGTVTADPGNDAPTSNTGRVRLTVQVQMDPVFGQTNPDAVSFTSEINLRNSSYMLRQY